MRNSRLPRCCRAVLGAAGYLAAWIVVSCKGEPSDASSLPQVGGMAAVSGGLTSSAGLASVAPSPIPSIQAAGEPTLSSSTVAPPSESPAPTGLGLHPSAAPAPGKPQTEQPIGVTSHGTARALAPAADAMSAGTMSAGAAPTRPGAALISSSAVTGEGYRTYLQLPSPLVVGRETVVTVHLEPQSPFKSNDKYPYRFTIGTAQGVRAPSAPVTGASITATRTTLRFPVTATSVGHGSISGTFSFSVCTDEKCLVERAPLVLGFEVRADGVSGTHP